VDTERWDDAIQILNDIVKKDENYENSLLLRSESKFMLAAYEGAKKDVISYFGNKGIDAESTGLYGRILYALDKEDAALATLSSAIAIEPSNPKYLELRADIYASNGKLLSACEDWNNAYLNGSSKVEYNLDKYCGGSTKPVVKSIPTKVDRTKVVPVEEEYEDEVTESENPRGSHDGFEYSKPEYNEDVEPQVPDVITNGSDYTSENENSDDVMGDDVFADHNDDELNEEFDNTVNTIVIDEDLTLNIYGRGLGTRKILDRPSILILSDVNGEVTVEVCINERGKVETAEFNPKMSSIDKKSLVSLAIRKSKDFWFEKNDKKEQCGFIVFKIKAS
jgi:tetratricopeptide (TPR) repeat protein